MIQLLSIFLVRSGFWKVKTCMLNWCYLTDNVMGDMLHIGLTLFQTREC